MDKFTKNYIDDIVKPMINRIQSLERSNEELRVHVKYLQSLICNQKTYQKPTVSAANHMRDSRISSKGQSSEKRPTWSSKTKIIQSPTTSNKQKEIVHHQKIKTKPPIPKIMKSPNKAEPNEDMRASFSDKKIVGGVKTEIQKLDCRVKNQDSTVNSRVNQPDIKQVRQKKPDLGTFSNKFEQLIKNNTEILSSMKQISQPAKDILNAAPNYVQKGATSISQYHQSQSTSPNERSFTSQQPENDMKILQGLKVNPDCNTVKIQLK